MQFDLTDPQKNLRVRARGLAEGHVAKRAAEKAVETQRSVTINLELNSYGRRIVHLAIADIEGVSSASEERDGRKVVQVVPV